MMQLPVRLLTAFTLLLGLSSCDQQAFELRPEHVSIEELEQQLRQSVDFKNIASDSSLELISQQAPAGAASLRVHGSRLEVARIVQIAQAIDRPQSYYLHVRNARPGIISIETKQMKILLHPKQQIALGRSTIEGGPWGGYLARDAELLQLILDEKRVLKIDINNGDGESYYSGDQPLQLERWVKMHALGRDDKPLWLRLTKASSQSD